MKKMLQRSISIILALSLCLVAMQFTALADTVTKAGLQTLSEWIEMADDLLSQGKKYASGKTEFDAAYNSAKSILESESASDEAIIECIEDLKTAWAGLKNQTVTEIVPKDGIANDTGYANFGSSYKTASGKQPKIYYNINATGADFWSDIEMVYLYAYGYQTATVTEDLISGTTLPKGGTNASPNGIRLCTTDYVNSAYASSAEGYVNRGGIKKIEFSKAKLSKFIAVGKVSQIMFCYQGDSNPNATLCAGSLFIVRSAFEQVPVSYELYKWVNRAENLLAQGKTYTSGLDEFNAAIDAAKNATAADDVDTLIANIKTAWQALNYLDTLQIAPDGGVDNDTGYANFGSSYKTVNGKQPKINYTINATGADFWSDIEMIYLYAYGYQTESVTEDMISGTTLPIGSKNAATNGIRLCTTDYVNSAYASSEKGYVVRNSVIKIEFSKAKLSNFINLGKLSQIMFCYQGDNSPNATLCAGSIFIVKGEKVEKLPSDRIFNWIDRAEKVLDMDVEFSDSLDEFNAAVEAMYNADSTSNDDALIADLREAWNNLSYDVTYEIGAPTIEKGTDTTTSYTKEDDKLGSNYVCAQSDGTAMTVRLDCDIVGGFTTDWFNDVKEIFFYTRGYQTADTSKAWSSKWTNATVNTNFSSSKYYGGSDVNWALSKYTIAKDTLLTVLNGNSFRNILITQNTLGEADSWVVGSLFVTKTYKISLADYGDVNGDGNVDVRDIVRSKKYLAGITNEISDYSLDMNDDGRNAVDDLVAIRNKILNG